MGLKQLNDKCSEEAAHAVISTEAWKKKRITSSRKIYNLRDSKVDQRIERPYLLHVQRQRYLKPEYFGFNRNVFLSFE